eukprot:jgi/Chrzof1/13576/Cz08g02210.t1
MGTLVVPPSESRAPFHLAHPPGAAVASGNQPPLLAVGASKRRLCKPPYVNTHPAVLVGLRGSLQTANGFWVAKAGTFSWCNLFSRQALGCHSPVLAETNTCHKVSHRV